MKHSIITPAVLAAAFVSITATTPTASADVIFSQTPTVAEAFVSDRDATGNGQQTADEFTLTSAATARSVTWQGAYILGNTPVAPLSFDLIFYGDAGGLPDTGNILSSTTVTFNSIDDITDTGVNVGAFDVYEFSANLTPTALPAGSQIWFSVLADTSNDPDDNFVWATGFNFTDASQRNDLPSGDPFVATNFGDFYFVLDDAAIPEPASLALLSLAGLGLLRRRR